MIIIINTFVISYVFSCKTFTTRHNTANILPVVPFSASFNNSILFISFIKKSHSQLINYSWNMHLNLRRTYGYNFFLRMLPSKKIINEEKYRQFQIWTFPQILSIEKIYLCLIHNFKIWIEGKNRYSFTNEVENSFVDIEAAT